MSVEFQYDCFRRELERYMANDHSVEARRLQFMLRVLNDTVRKNKITFRMVQVSRRKCPSVRRRLLSLHSDRPFAWESTVFARQRVTAERVQRCDARTTGAVVNAYVFCEDSHR